MEEPKVCFPMIYKSIAEVISDVGSVGKDKVNKQQGFKFRSVDDVYNALHPALAKNKVFIVPEILDQQREIKRTKSGTEMIYVICRIKFTFFAEDGSSVESVIIGEALDTGDKATNKAMAIAYKYACFQVFCIPTEEIIDPDGERPELEEDKSSKKGKMTAKQGKETGKPTEKQTDDEEQRDPSKVLVTDVMIHTMQSELERTGVAEEQILNLFKVKALKDMTVAHFQKVMKKFQATPDKKEGAY